MAKVAPLRDFFLGEQIEPPALLTLDVQGYESPLHRFAHACAECSFVELYADQALADVVIAWLRKRGFQLRGVHNMSYDNGGRAIQGDFLSAPK